MFDGKTSCVRRFHTLSDAVIVIDEVQSVPNKLISLFHLTISFLAKLCGTTVVLCSATQPDDTAVEHPIRSKVQDLIQYDPKLWHVFVRTKLQNAGTFRLEDVPAFADKVLENANSLLIVCNKKTEAQSLLQMMQDSGYDLFHLSASMCMAHRKKVLEQIYQALKQPYPHKTVCISTQVIEAGIDISFASVIRLAAGMDSIVQSAGRCNRNGESNTALPVYIVQVADENLSRLPEIRMAKQATQQLLMLYDRMPEQYGNDLASEQAVRSYYRELFCIQQRTDRNYHDYPLQDQTTLFSMLSENEHWRSANERPMYAFSQAFASAGAMFSVFDTDAVDVIVPYEDGETIICNLLSERAAHDLQFVRQKLLAAKQYTVSLYTYQRKKLEAMHALIPLAGGAAFGLDAAYYNRQTGFSLNQEVEQECDILIL